MPISPGYLADSVIATDGPGPDVGGDAACAVATVSLEVGSQAQIAEITANSQIRQAFRN